MGPFGAVLSMLGVMALFVFVGRWLLSVEKEELNNNGGI
jgi:hypothetical protein